MEVYFSLWYAFLSITFLVRFVLCGISIRHIQAKEEYAQKKSHTLPKYVNH